MPQACGGLVQCLFTPSTWCVHTSPSGGLEAPSYGLVTLLDDQPTFWTGGGDGNRFLFNCSNETRSKGVLSVGYVDVTPPRDFRKRVG